MFKVFSADMTARIFVPLLKTKIQPCDSRTWRFNGGRRRAIFETPN